MSRYKRIAALLISVLMILSLTGCKQKSNEDPGETSPDSSLTSEVSSEDSKTPQSSENDDKSGHESTVINNSGSFPSYDDKTCGSHRPDTNNNAATKPDPAPQNDKKAPLPEVPEEDKPSGGTESDTPEAFQLSDVQPIIKEGRYHYNPYLLSKETIRCFDIGFLEFYKDFLTAYMNYRTSCACPNVEYAKIIDMVLSYECPFYSGDDLEFSWATNYDYEAQRLNWTYEVDKETLKERIRLVADAMQDFLNLVTPADDEADKVQTLYHAFCPLMTYAYDRADSREKIDGCYALLEHTGICVTFSYAFAQILAQADVDATIASGAASDGVPHVWNYACINGQYYFFDTTFELNFKAGNAFIYYGMNLEDRVDSGVPADMIWLGRYQDYEFVVAENHLNVR